MDRLDRYGVIALVLLLAAAVPIGVRFRDELKHKASDRAKQSTIAVSSGAVDPRVKTARDLVLAGEGAKAEPLLREMLKNNPYDAELHMLMGDLEMKKLDPVGSLAHYQEAIDLNPDYLDKKTPTFQGKKIKVAIEEARGEIEQGLTNDPGNDRLVKAKKTMYYLLRRIAGSCG